jgi:hypothetical protein
MGTVHNLKFQERPSGGGLNTLFRGEKEVGAVVILREVNDFYGK